MAPVKNGRVVFKEPVGEGYPDAEKTFAYDEAQTIDVETAPLRGGVLVKTLVLSVDPYLRARVREPHVPSYIEPFVQGEPIASWGIGVVVRSEDPATAIGTHIYGMLPFQHYSVLPDIKGAIVLANEEKLPWSAFVGVAGMPGATAYAGWKEFAAPKAGDVVFISAGSGAVGSLVVQLAKQDGLKVIASAGSDEKVQILTSIGADVAFNYKTTRTADVLAKEGPINIYWDNVGGETLDTAIAHAADCARFILCGMISEYNTPPPRMHNHMLIVARQLRLFGLAVPALFPKYAAEFYATVPRMVASGRVRHREDVREGLGRASQAIVDVQRGRTEGKCVVVVAEE